jgi:hypothetical protein
VQRLAVVVLLVRGVLLQNFDGLAGRTWRGGEQNNEPATDALELVDVPLDIEYDDTVVSKSGTNF